MVHHGSLQLTMIVYGRPWSTIVSFVWGPGIISDDIPLIGAQDKLKLKNKNGGHLEHEGSQKLNVKDLFWDSRPTKTAYKHTYRHSKMGIAYRVDN